MKRKRDNVKKLSKTKETNVGDDDFEEQPYEQKVKMTDIKEQIADIEEEIETRELKISTELQKINILKKRLTRLQNALSGGEIGDSSTVEAKKTVLGKTPIGDSTAEARKIVLGKTPIGDSIAEARKTILGKTLIIDSTKNTEEKITEEHPQAQCSQEKKGIQNPTNISTDQPLVGINTSLAGTKGDSPIPHKQLFDSTSFSPIYLQKSIRARPRMPPQNFRPPPSESSRFKMFSYKDIAQTSTERIPDRFVNLGKIPKAKEDNTITGIPLQEFLTLEAEARVIGGSAPKETYYGTFDKKFGQFIFLKGADPTMVQTAFHCGLIKMIIPGDDLEEIKLLDSNLVQSLQDFKKFVIKDQDTKLILRINSTIPFWDENETLYKGYHHIQIKTVQKIFLDRPIEGEPRCVNELILQEWRSLSFQRILTTLKTFDRESKIKINHSSRFILMTSRTSSTISTKGIKTLCRFEENFYNLINAPNSYSGQLCKALKSSLGKYHECQWCGIIEETDGTSLKKEESNNSNTNKDNQSEEKAFSDKD